MKTKFFAVLHVTARQYNKLATLCSRVIEKLTDNSADFTDPDPKVEDLKTENTKLITLKAEAKGNTQKKDERDAQALVVYEMLLQERDYVNGIAKGDKVLIAKSGFDCDKTPEEHGIPPVPAIRKIEDGNLAHSARIFLVSPLTKGARYSVQMFPITANGGGGITGFDPDKLPWQYALEGVNSRELLLINLTRGVDIAIRVRAEDGSKKSGWSDPYLFLPR